MTEWPEESRQVTRRLRLADFYRIRRRRKAKTPAELSTGVFGFRCLAMSYSRMGRPHTTIGDDAFHF